MNILDEVWKDIPDYEGFYKVSNFGLVKSYDRIVQAKGRSKRLKSTVLKPCMSTSGYEAVRLWKDGKGITKSIHSLVALVFLGDRPYGCNINHKDGNKLNNCVDNLEYCTFSENTRHAYATGLLKVARGEKRGASKLKNPDIIVIRNRLALGHNHGAIAKDFNVSRSVISCIKTGRAWSHIE